ncbi:MAG: hypothetical protein ACRDN0_29190 [Trebonia sp.]
MPDTSRTANLRAHVVQPAFTAERAEPGRDGQHRFGSSLVSQIIQFRGTGLGPGMTPAKLVNGDADEQDTQLR